MRERWSDCSECENSTWSFIFCMKTPATSKCQKTQWLRYLHHLLSGLVPLKRRERREEACDLNRLQSELKLPQFVFSCKNSQNFLAWFILLFEHSCGYAHTMGSISWEMCKLLRLKVSAKCIQVKKKKRKKVNQMCKVFHIHQDLINETLFKCTIILWGLQKPISTKQ